MKFKTIIAITFISMLNTVCFAQNFNESVEAKIRVNALEDALEITGTAYNKTEINQSLRYELAVIKKNPVNGNLSKNNQNGRFVLAPGEKKELATTLINKTEKDNVIVLLLVYNLDDELIGKDRFAINDSPQQNQQEAIKKKMQELEASKDVSESDEDGITLTGIVIENVKTKPARDFYKLFYSEYMLTDLKTKKVIRIDEELQMGNSTIIKVFVDDKMIYQFIVNPNTEYLKAKSNQTIQIIGRYLAYLQKNKEVFQHY
jgi:hypothetical protein